MATFTIEEKDLAALKDTVVVVTGAAELYKHLKFEPS